MEHAVREQGNVLVVSLKGEVDLDNSPRAREILLDCGGRGQQVFVDLSGVTYIDSSDGPSANADFVSTNPQFW